MDIGHIILMLIIIGMIAYVALQKVTVEPGKKLPRDPDGDAIRSAPIRIETREKIEPLNEGESVRLVDLAGDRGVVAIAHLHNGALQLKSPITGEFLSMRGVNMGAAAQTRSRQS
jgi:hypothetical protein